MTTKLKVLIGLMAASLAGGAGGAFALTRNSASSTGTAGAFDKAVYLYWGSESSTASLENVDDLVANTPQYRYLSVTPKSSKGVSGTVTLNFELESGGASTHMKGLTVSVYKTASLATDLTVASLIDGVSAAPVLDESHLTGSTTFTVSTAADVHETEAFYAIKVVWTGINDSEHPTYALGASLTINQSFGA